MCIIIMSVLLNCFFLLLFYENVLKLLWSIYLLFVWFYENIPELLWGMYLLSVLFQKYTEVAVRHKSAFLCFNNVHHSEPHKVDS